MTTPRQAANAPLTIRPLEPRDRAEWDVLWAGYNAFYGRAGETALPAEVSDTALQAGVRNLFDRQYAQPLGGVDIAAFEAGGSLAPVPAPGRSFELGASLHF